VSKYKAELHALKGHLHSHPWLFARYADLLIRDGQQAKALHVLRTGLQDFPDYLSGHQKMGEYQAQTGTGSGGSQHFERAMSLAQGLSLAWLSALEVKSRQPDQHEILLQEALELDIFHVQLRKMGIRAGLLFEDERDADSKSAHESLDREQAYEPTDPEGAQVEAPQDAGEEKSEQTKQREARLLTSAERLSRMKESALPVESPSEVVPGPLMAVKHSVQSHGIHSQRLADIYLNQGYLDLALDVIKRLEERDAPGHALLREAYSRAKTAVDEAGGGL
jgi:hypothetical protein